MNQVLENVQDLMPNILDNALPDTTGKIMPISNSKNDDTDKEFWDYIEKRNKEYIEWETKGKWENL